MREMIFFFKQESILLSIVTIYAFRIHFAFPNYLFMRLVSICVKCSVLFMCVLNSWYIVWWFIFEDMNENGTKKETFSTKYTSVFLKDTILLGLKSLLFVYVGGGSLKSVLKDKEI